MSNIMKTKDYALIASTIKNNLEAIKVESGSEEAIEKAVSEITNIAYELARGFDYYTNFDKDTFLHYCGL